MTIEICANSRQSALNALKGGVHRIELCRDLSCGGLTPTDEDIDYCVRQLRLRTHVLVRPRAGNFYYNDDELADIERSILRCKELGVAAVVVGFLTREGSVDVELTRRMVQLAAPMEVTFHRAFDEAHQPPLEALQAVMEAGCHRLLTSGQHPTALEGAEVIKQLVQYSTLHSPLSTLHSPLTILAGGGITPLNAQELVAATGVTELHGSCKNLLPDGTLLTDPEQVRQLKLRTKN